MAGAKVSCPGCGKKTTDELAERCRICGAILPDAARRRADNLSASTAGPAFAELVESEVDAWKEYEAAGDAPPKSRRPAELGTVETKRFSFKRGGH